MLPPEIDSIIFLNKIISKLNELQISHMLQPSMTLTVTGMVITQ